jgi:uncharacterized protein (DUF1499 family)
MRTRSTWIWLLTGAAILGFGPGASAARQGLATAGLKPCPDSPNCVSSLDADPRRRVEPIVYKGSPAEARQKLLVVVRAMPRTRVRPEEGGTLRVEFSSAIFRFVDDVEFLIEEARPLIQVRSASRVGYWDMGANRRRVENIRRMMTRETP